MPRPGTPDDDRTELVPPPAGEAAVAAPPPARFGAYALRKELGRGGQGVVYLADDTRLGRQVALKVLSAGFAADTWSRLRFEREATACARLDHPGICTVYEAGATDGLPYIAMRLVAGESLAARIRRRREETLARGTASSSAAARRRQDLAAEVEIVEKAARALHAAHEAGLVHRDVKPGNIMVEPSGQPVILDFGLARDANVADVSLTGTGTFLGTPAYMSPEQAAGGTAVDRRTDVWSLGVTLFELLTLSRPFEGATLEALLRAIRSADAPDPRRLDPSIPPDLAAVLAMALEKEPGRRYQDAAAFADDLGRARRLEPVRARPAGAATRLRRWAQRNPALSASLAVVFLALAAGLAISLHALGRAGSALDRESAALAEAKDQRGRAEDLLGFMLGEMKTRLEGVGRLELLGKVARKAAEYYATKPLDLGRPDEALSRAAALRNLGDVVRAEGDLAAAAARYGDAIAIEEALLARDPRDAAAVRGLAISVNAVAALDLLRGRAAEAAGLAERSLGLRRRLLELRPGDDEALTLHAAGLVMLGNTLKAKGDIEASIPVYREAIGHWRALCASEASAARRRELAVALQNLGDAFRLTDRSDDGITAREEGLALFEALAREEPAHREWQEQVATTRHGLALALRSAGRLDAATEHSRGAVAVFRRLRDEDAGNTRRHFQLGTGLHLLGVILADRGLAAEALAACEEGLASRARLLDFDSTNRVWKTDVAESSRAAASALASLGRAAEAAARQDEAARILRALAAEKPEDAAVARRSLTFEFEAAQRLRECGRPAEALERSLAAAGTARALARAAPDEAAARLRAAEVLEAAADAHHELRDDARARATLGEAVAERRAVLDLAADPDLASAQHALARALLRLGSAGGEATDPEVRAGLEEALGALDHLPGAALDEEIRRDRLRVLSALREVHVRAGDFEPAIAAGEECRRVHDALPAAARRAFDGPEPASRLADIARLRELVSGSGAAADARDHALLGLHLEATGKPVDALPHLAAALADEDGADPLPDPRLELLLARARAAARAASGSTGDAAESRRREALDALRASVALLRREEALAAERIAAAVEKRGLAPEGLRVRLAGLRCRIAVLRDHDPAFETLRGAPGFAAPFAP